MTLSDDDWRDLFAGLALAGLLTQRNRRLHTRAAVRRLTLAAFELADDMLIVRAGGADDADRDHATAVLPGSGR